jgi:hypothetical protein
MSNVKIKPMKFYAYVALNGEIIVHPYHRLQDITSTYGSMHVMDTLPNEFEAKDHDEARKVAYELFRKAGRNPKKPK